MYKKKLINKIGYYPKQFKYAQDYAFYLKTYKKYKIDILKKKLTNIRLPHIYSETNRLQNLNIIHNEEIKLLLWSYKNLNPNFFEKIMIFIKLLKIKIKKII